MFGSEFLDQLKNLKDATDSGMTKLPEIIVDGSAGNGLVKLKMDGTYALKDLQLAVDLTLIEKDDLEDYLALALNDAIAKVTALREKALMHSLTGLMGSK